MKSLLKGGIGAVVAVLCAVLIENGVSHLRNPAHDPSLFEQMNDWMALPAALIASWAIFMWLEKSDVPVIGKFIGVVVVAVLVIQFGHLL